MTLLDDLRGTRAVVARQWPRGCMLVCMNIHLNRVGAEPYVTGPPKRNERWHRTEAMVAALGFKRSGDMYNWNDAYHRTKEDVLARFDEAIAKVGGVAEVGWP